MADHSLQWTQPGPDETWWGTPPGKWCVARVIPRSQTQLDAEGPYSAMPRVVRQYWLLVFLHEDVGEFATAEEGMRRGEELWDAYRGERRL